MQVIETMTPKRQHKSTAQSDTPSVISAQWTSEFLHSFQLELVEILSANESLHEHTDYREVVKTAMRGSLMRCGIDDEQLLEALVRTEFPDSEPEIARKWDDVANRRRLELIDREIQGQLDWPGKVELVQLTQLMREATDNEVNLPISGALEIHRRLLETPQS